MIVVDASVLVAALVDEGEVEGRLADRLSLDDLAAPELVDLEVLSALRREVRRGALSEARCDAARRALRDLPLRRERHGRLLEGVWALRHNLSAYDAAYVALAEALACPLLTADRRLAAAPGLPCAVEVLL